MKTPKQFTIYSQMQRMADVCKTLIDRGNLGRATRLLDVAGDLFVKGNRETQNAVSNVFLYSLTMWLEWKGAVEREILALLPASLQEEYRNQIHALGV